MYNLGDYFKIDCTNAKANPKAIIQGVKYRITILTERLVRLEYSPNSMFEDLPTQIVWNRSFNVPNFEIKNDTKYLEVTTKYFKLIYNKEKPFEGSKLNPTSNLSIQLLNSDRIWYYGHPEIRNLGAPNLNLTDLKGNMKLGKGLYSLDGFASIDDSKNSVIDESGCVVPRKMSETDIYVFMYNNDFKDCLKDYYALTGYPSLIPRYALGNWWSRNVSYDDESLSDLVNNFNDSDIPLSVMLLNRDWHIREYKETKNLKTGFAWNKKLFKAPFETVELLHSNGIRLGLDINPLEGIYPFEDYYLKAKEYLEADDKGVIPFNALNPKFIDVYLKLMIHPLDSLGVDFYWIDCNDDKRLNDLGLLSHYHTYDMMRNYKRRPMVLGKNANKAAHRYPVLYSGKTLVNWDTLKNIPFFNASAANIGVSFWAHDIGGYYKGMEDEELYTRFVQLGTFSPILKFGADKGKYYKREPWRWNVKTYRIVKDYLTLRHRLIPYLYTESYRYHKEGIPLVRPLYYEYPDIYDNSNYRNEYYFGSGLLVAPIITKKDIVMNRVIHRMFIPEGTWYDIVTGKKFPGNRNYISFFKDEDYPVFAKAGSIIPYGENDNLNDTTPPKNMEIQIFPGVSNTYHMYEDDGLSDLYKKGFYLRTDIDYNYLPNNYTVIIRSVEGKSGIVPEYRNYKIRFRNTKPTEQVEVYFKDQKVIHKKYQDRNDFVVEVENIPSIGQLTINCKGTDIEIEAVHVINEDIESIISDLPITTEMKEKIDSIVFGAEPIKKKRIAIRKLDKKGLEQKFIKLFLKLLEYIEQV